MSKYNVGDTVMYQGKPHVIKTDLRGIRPTNDTPIQIQSVEDRDMFWVNESEITHEVMEMVTDAMKFRTCPDVLPAPPITDKYKEEAEAFIEKNKAIINNIVRVYGMSHSDRADLFKAIHFISNDKNTICTAHLQQIQGEIDRLCDMLEMSVNTVKSGGYAIAVERLRSITQTEPQQVFSMEEWISVKDRLPENEQEVYFHNRGYQQVYKGKFIKHDAFQRENIFIKDKNWFDNVEYWMPCNVPPPPTY